MNSDITQEPLPPPLIKKPDRIGSRPWVTTTADCGGAIPEASFREHYMPMERSRTPMHIVDALLKRPAQIIYEVTQGGSARVVLTLLSVLVVCMLGYGFVVGTFSGGHQLWAAPLKLSLGLLFSALICLPSLYIFMCLSGAKQSLTQILGLFAATLALSGILLVGFAPVSWVFAQATNAPEFMGTMHLAFWGVGTIFGLRLLESANKHLNRSSSATLRTWCVVFILVVLQMTTTLRPLVGEYQGLQLLGKKFFIKHWMAPNKEAPATQLRISRQ